MSNSVSGNTLLLLAVRRDVRLLFGLLRMLLLDGRWITIWGRMTLKWEDGSSFHQKRESLLTERI